MKAFSLDIRTYVCYNKSMNKAIKYRLYPTTEQAVMFAKTFG
ncbi:MAG: helix-turn-helix domain-containing protein, partial [Lachnospiraceae bacterium]|nr:helix-turn-helix domain-containing protein [Lachnospiraceae bacterium]